MTARVSSAYPVGLRRRGLHLWALLLPVWLVAGLAVAHGKGPTLAAALLVGLGFLVGIVDWRRSIYGLLLYLPFSGIVVVALYPHTTPGVLAKDFLFVLPAYVGFFTEFNTRRRPIVFRDAPTVLLGLLALLVLAQALNPNLPNLLVGLIGIKVWLLYIPMLFLGYHLVSSERDLLRLLAVMAAASVLPAVIGVVQAALISGGHPDLAFRPYGKAASAVTQNFAAFRYIGAGSLHRVPSTFSFATQYYIFTASMIAISYALWRGFLADSSRRVMARALWLLMLAAAFLSGARGAFVMVPLLVLLIVFLERGSGFPALGRVLSPAVILMSAGALVGATAAQLVRQALFTAAAEFNSILVDGFRHAFAITWAGLGAGIDSSGSRYAFSSHSRFEAVSGSWNESWYVKVVLELGVPGLVLVALLIGVVVVGGLRRHRAVSDPRLRVVSAALLAFLLWNLIYGLKGQYIDLDPVNVYFWLLGGVLMRVWALDAEKGRGVSKEPA